MKNYLSKISGPLLDRIDIHVEVPAAEHHKLRSGTESESILETAMHKLALSARAHHRIIRVSQTIADLDGADTISVHAASSGGIFSLHPSGHCS